MQHFIARKYLSFSLNLNINRRDIKLNFDFGYKKNNFSLSIFEKCNQLFLILKLNRSKIKKKLNSLRNGELEYTVR